MIASPSRLKPGDRGQFIEEWRKSWGKKVSLFLISSILSPVCGRKVRNIIRDKTREKNTVREKKTGRIQCKYRSKIFGVVVYPFFSCEGGIKLFGVWFKGSKLCGKKQENNDIHILFYLVLTNATSFGFAVILYYVFTISNGNTALRESVKWKVREE